MRVGRREKKIFLLYNLSQNFCEFFPKLIKVLRIFSKFTGDDLLNFENFIEAKFAKIPKTFVDFWDTFGNLNYFSQNF